ncbi:hypothetical protein HALLA_17460 [Halostagnicola larsenii XH-48]|uniref:VOC domain-containing protein n=1 Tax=Halostagnicola larsenii XH-48 TaxID=797299 RepID=W0JVN5_9EURY|nr:VOC family protein [Halostagnicola larsenii]AHG01128.1 hypothetical protein HALLA_17460 [Halostagnicola larsenii XH-48]
MTHVLNWFEIPSTDFDRAVDFYSVVLERDIDVHSPGEDDAVGERAGMFHVEDGEVGGMIVESDEYTAESGAKISYEPTDSGLVIYLSVDGDLDDVLARVDSNGGETVIPKESIPEMESHFAVITDSEGNRVGLVSNE